MKKRKVVSGSGCKCKNSKCLKLYCECFARQDYCNNCSCKNCNNLPAHEEKRKHAMDVIIERNPQAFDKAVTGGTQRGCNCKRSQCLKKYCECFQAGLACLEECKCVSCQNFDGSEVKARVLAGEDLDTIRAKKLKEDQEGQEEEDDFDYDGKRRGRYVPTRTSRRKTVVYDDEDSPNSSVMGNNNHQSHQYRQHFSEQEPVPPTIQSSIQLTSSFPVKPPPVHFPSGSNRTFRNQLVRLDLCSFVGSAMESYTNLMLVGTEQNHSSNVPVVKTETNNDEHLLKTNEKMPESSLIALQEKFVLEETANMLRKCLQSTKNAVESSKIIKF